MRRPRRPAAPALRERAADQARFDLFDAVTRLLVDGAAERPMLVVLDDLHWADADSVRLLGFLARQLARSRVLVVGAYREVEAAAPDHPLRRLLAEVGGAAGVVPLEGLDRVAVEQLLRRLTGGEVTAAAAGAVHERTGSNPFFVHQLARLLAAQPGGLAAARIAPVPAGVRIPGRSSR